MEYQRDEHRVHLIVYHLVWTPKRRKAVLTGSIAQDCRQLIEDECTRQGWHMLELAVQSDYIHLFVQVWPTVSAAEVVKVCKDLTSHELREKYPQLLKLPLSVDAQLLRRQYRECLAGNDCSLHRRAEGVMI